MRNDSSEYDLRTIWQNQPTEPSVMTLEKIRQKTQELRARTRRELIKSIAGPLLGGVITQYLSWQVIFWLNLPLGLAAILMSDHGARRMVGAVADEIRAGVVRDFGDDQLALCAGAVDRAEDAEGRAEAIAPRRGRHPEARTPVQRPGGRAHHQARGRAPADRAVGTGHRECAFPHRSRGDRSRSGNRSAADSTSGCRTRSARANQQTITVVWSTDAHRLRARG